MLELQSTVDGVVHLLLEHLEHLELALRYVGRLAQVQLVVIDQNPGLGQEDYSAVSSEQLVDLTESEIECA